VPVEDQISLASNPAVLLVESSYCGGRADVRIVSHFVEGVERHVAGAVHGILIARFEQNCSDNAHDGFII
jgi:hypothetical protein